MAFVSGRKLTFDTGEYSCHLGINRTYPNVLCGGDAGRIESIIPLLDSSPEPERVESRRRHVTVHGFYHGVPVTAFSHGIGTASVSATLPEILEASDDADMIVIRLGTSGGLQKNLNVGDLVVTTSVARYESTSDKIMGEGYVAASSDDVMIALAEAAGKAKYGFQQVYAGQTVVTDELYFFNEFLRNQEGHGENLAISMESSTIFALRDAYNQRFGYSIRAGEILTVSDLVVQHEIVVMDRAEFAARQMQIEDSLLKTGLETIYALRQ